MQHLAIAIKNRKHSHPITTKMPQSFKTCEKNDGHVALKETFIESDLRDFDSLLLIEDTFLSIWS